jgi:hypothetical protein
MIVKSVYILKVGKCKKVNNYGYVSKKWGNKRKNNNQESFPKVGKLQVIERRLDNEKNIINKYRIW